MVLFESLVHEAPKVFFTAYLWKVEERILVKIIRGIIVEGDYSWLAEVITQNLAFFYFILFFRLFLWLAMLSFLERKLLALKWCLAVKSVEVQKFEKFTLFRFILLFNTISLFPQLSVLVIQVLYCIIDLSNL